jgi:hypothetical protein
VRYADDLIIVEWHLQPSGAALELRNASQSPLVVSWDGGSLVDPFGISHRSVRGQTKFVDVQRPQVPSVLPPGARVHETLWPAENTSYDATTGWTITPMWPDKAASIAEVEFLIGQKSSVMLSFTHADRNLDYLFGFRLLGIRAAGSIQSPALR